jgi:hypothetical protein
MRGGKFFQSLISSSLVWRGSQRMSLQFKSDLNMEYFKKNRTSKNNYNLYNQYGEEIDELLSYEEDVQNTLNYFNMAINQS